MKEKKRNENSEKLRGNENAQKQNAYQPIVERILNRARREAGD